MRNLQKGFTLIELMIVVAIIGILAAIAIPQYQDYITRAKWQDNLARVQTFKTAIAECLQNNAGTTTECDTEAEVISATNVASVTGISSATLASVSFAANALVITGTAAVGACVVTIAPNLTGSSVAWSYANSGPAGCNKAKTGVGT